MTHDLPTNVSRDLSSITDVASRIQHVQPQAARELDTAVLNLRIVLSGLFPRLAASADEIEANMNRSTRRKHFNRGRGSY